jgi:hypothetical protein
MLPAPSAANAAAALDVEVFGMDRAQKRAWLLEGLNRLTAHHRAHCSPYARILDGLWSADQAPSLEQAGSEEHRRRPGFAHTGFQWHHRRCRVAHIS